MSDAKALQFVDTNVLIYAHDLSAGDKHLQAKALLKWSEDLTPGRIYAGVTVRSPFS